MTSSPRRIVVAVDNSLNSRLALEHATRRAGPDGQLIVAHVMSSVPDALAKVMALLQQADHSSSSFPLPPPIIRGRDERKALAP